MLSELPDPVVPAAGAPVSAPAAAACEGQRPAANRADCSVRPCQRPGCYVLFAVAAALSP